MQTSHLVIEALLNLGFLIVLFFLLEYKIRNLFGQEFIVVINKINNLIKLRELESISLELFFQQTKITLGDLFVSQLKNITKNLHGERQPGSINKSTSDTGGTPE